MIEITNRLKTVIDRERWVARGASFVAKAKATKAVWFPPHPAEAGKTAASSAKKTTKKTGKKTSGAAKKTSKKTSGAAKKVSGTAKK
jgi:hypothetical protein